MTSKVHPGRDPKPLDETKIEIIKALRKSPQRWTELEINPQVFEQAKSTAILDRALKELIEEGLIVQAHLSHKNRPYTLTEDAKSLVILQDLDELLRVFKETLLEIDPHTPEPTIQKENEEAIRYILNQTELVNNKILRTYVLAEPNIKPYFKKWVLTQILETNMETIDACNKILPKTTQRVLSTDAVDTSKLQYPPKPSDEILQRLVEAYTGLVSHFVND
jgi:DNA-binding HxlR family transcriptional regulator